MPVSCSWCGQAGLDLVTAQGETQKRKLSGQRVKKPPSDVSSPPSSSHTRSTRQHNPNRRGNQNVHLLFAVARELLSRGKKQAELSAISCFLGLFPSFLRGGPGRFVLVPSCSSAPLSGGLCRPRRNAAPDPRGPSSEAPPTCSGPRLQPPEAGSPGPAFAPRPPVGLFGPATSWLGSTNLTKGGFLLFLTPLKGDPKEGSQR